MGLPPPLPAQPPYPRLPGSDLECSRFGERKESCSCLRAWTYTLPSAWTALPTVSSFPFRPCEALPDILSRGGCLPALPLTTHCPSEIICLLARLLPWQATCVRPDTGSIRFSAVAPILRCYVTHAWDLISICSMNKWLVDTLKGEVNTVPVYRCGN